MSFSNCSVCSASIPMDYQSALCPVCLTQLPGRRAGSRKRGGDYQWSGSSRVCIVLGSVAVALGMVFLMDPNVDPYGGIEVAHALALGQAFTIAGAVLVGFGIRPR